MQTLFCKKVEKYFCCPIFSTKQMLKLLCRNKDSAYSSAKTELYVKYFR